MSKVMTGENLRLFFIGAEDIDSKRERIRRVLTTLEHLFFQFKKSTRDIPEGVFPIQFENFELGVYLGRTKNQFTIKMPDDSFPRLCREEIPKDEVLVIYEALPEIITELDERFPELGINEHFEFFIQYAQSLNPVEALEP